LTDTFPQWNWLSISSQRWELEPTNPSHKCRWSAKLARITSVLPTIRPLLGQ
jgi:hypothetical protein